MPIDVFLARLETYEGRFDSLYVPDTLKLKLFWDHNWFEKNWPEMLFF